MAAKNNGKKFESSFRCSCEKNGVLNVRFIDSNKFGQNNSARFTPNSPCDCLIHNGNGLIFIEQKTTINTSISFNNPPDKKINGKSPSIKPHQIKFLMESENYTNTYGGLLVEFSDREVVGGIIEGGTYYIPVRKFYDWATKCGKCSINQKDAELIGYKLKRKLKKVNYEYDVVDLINTITNKEIV